jgi:hypothetical protein
MKEEELESRSVVAADDARDAQLRAKLMRDSEDMRGLSRSLVFGGLVAVVLIVFVVLGRRGLRNWALEFAR